MKTVTKIVHWAPRIICILSILLVSMFALDSFSPDRTFWQNMAALLIHLVPSFVLVVILIIAWRWELAGGIILTIIGVALSIFVFNHNYNMNHSVGKTIGLVLIIVFPFVLSGVLFIISHFQMKKSESN